MYLMLYYCGGGGGGKPGGQERSNLKSFLSSFSFLEEGCNKIMFNYQYNFVQEVVIQWPVYLCISLACGFEHPSPDIYVL